jgi:peptide/nickel transport system ATP-binding protein
MSDDLLQQAIGLIKAGRKREAQPLLQGLIKADPKNVAAWLWYVETCQSVPERLKVLEVCQKFNPTHPQVQKALVAVQAAPVSSFSEQSAAMPTETRSFVLCDNLFKIYKVADLEVVALQGLNLEIAQGEMMALVGPSGVGKSTLLNVIGGLDTPSAGGVWVAGWDLLRMKDRERVEYKRQVVGFVWQQPARNLLPYLSARENVELPMQHNGVKTGVRRKRALELLDTVGLADRADFRPDRLSGGEQQRVALAVALANNPPLLLGDELTGQVDSESAMQVFDALRAINQAYGTTAIVVTHDPLVASRVDRVVTIRDGRTSTEIRRHRDRKEDSLHEEEWVILDPVGRLQLPRAYVNTLEMRERVRLHLEPDHVSVWPQKGDDQRATGNGRSLPVAHLQPAAGPSAGSGQALRLRSGQALRLRSGQALHSGQAGPPLDGLRAGRADVGVSVTLENLNRTYDLAGEKIHALQEVNLKIPAGSLSAIKGPSGSGKTTLLNLIAGLDEPTAGTVRFGERSLAEMSSQEKIDLCRQQIGFVFQTFGLLPFLSVEENVQVPLRLLYTSRQERQVLVDEVLDMVGLADRARHRTYELSGGEQQRVAIARALVKRPTLILADEPTGQLDSLTGASIIALLKEIVTQTGITVVVASHDPNVHEAADWIFELKDGRLVGTVDQTG